MGAAKKHALHMVSLSAINADDSLVRQHFNDEKLKELSISIKDQGILQPPILRQINGSKNQYAVVVGMRRVRAARLADLKEIPCIIYEVDDSAALEVALTENIQRDDLMPFEEALVIVKLMKEYEYSIIRVCEKIGKGDSYVRNRLKIMALSEPVQKLIVKEELGIEHATYLVDADPGLQLKLANDIIENSLTRDQARVYINEELIKKEEQKKTKKGKLSAADYAIKGSDGWKARYKRKTIVITPRRIELQIKNLVSVISGADFAKFQYVDRETLKGKLLELQRLINGAIKTISAAD